MDGQQSYRGRDTRKAPEVASEYSGLPEDTSVQSGIADGFRLKQKRVCARNASQTVRGWPARSCVRLREADDAATDTGETLDAAAQHTR